jgi:hypothetical protein
MTFNQWCSGKHFDPHTRIALEAIWSALFGAGCNPSRIATLLEDLLESLRGYDE